MIPVDKAYTDTIDFWYEFNFKKIYLEAHKEESSKGDGR